MTVSIAGLCLPALPTEHKLNRILASSLGQKSPFSPTVLETPPWDAACFNLSNCRLFTDAAAQEQQQILQLASQALLAESYAIERAGVGYMAKMTLLAETTEERMLYALFSADETTHLAQLMPFVAEPDALGDEDPFLQLLESLLMTGDRTALIFVIQVVLEGWGLSHYRTLSKHCRHRELGELFRSFLAAESRHHGAGILLFEGEQLSSKSRGLIVETLARFLQMVQVGPQRLVSAIAQVKGGLSHAQQVQLFTELDTETQSNERLSLLRSLITQASTDIAQQLDQYGLFTPLPPAQCALGDFSS